MMASHVLLINCIRCMTLMFMEWNVIVCLHGQAFYMLFSPDKQRVPRNPSGVFVLCYKDPKFHVILHLETKIFCLHNISVH